MTARPDPGRLRRRGCSAAAAVAVAPVVSPSAGADVADDLVEAGLSVLAPAGWEGAAGLPVAAHLEAVTPGPAGAELFNQFFYTPLHDGVQAWITSDFGQQVDVLINTLGLSTVIGNGTPGTEANPDGGSGGWLLGDGGAGWSSTAVEVAGGSGGDGGNAPGLFGIGGRGGDAGNGGIGGTPPGAHPLPALGGAGGNGGWLGSHGAVGHFGTIGGSTATGSSALSTAGGWIVDDAGRVVILHGSNQVQAGKIYPYNPFEDGFNDATAAFLAANGINSIRLGIQWAGVEPEPGVIDYDYLATIERAVQVLSDNGIYTVLDMHQDMYSESLAHIPYEADGAPAWATLTGGLPNPNFGFPLNYLLSPAQNHAWDALWTNAKAPDRIGLENHYAWMWQAVAHYFRDDPNVVGYEIMNEPWPGWTWLSTALGNPSFDHDQLTPFYNQVTSAIRSVDPTTTVYFEPSVLFTDVPQPVHLGTVEDPNTVFAFHDYCITFALFGGNFGCSIYDQVLQHFAQGYADEHNLPAVITEWGNTNNGSVLDDTMNVANQKAYGWLHWEDTILIHDRGAPPIGDNIDTAVQAALSEPYPPAIAGIPGPWSFSDGVLTFSYSTAMADGTGSFATGSHTDIAVPPYHYPDGYQVSVTGGHVVSAPNAPVLVIAADGGANTVSVTVSRA